MAQRGIAGPEIIEVNLHAESRAIPAARPQPPRAVHQCGLGDLEAKIGRLQSSLVHGLLDDSRELLLQQLPARHVDGDALETGRRKSTLPVRKRLARLLQHPCAHRFDQPQLLGDRHERRRRDRFTIARPSYERLEPDAHAGHEGHDRLILHLEVVAGNGAPDVVFEAQPIAHARMHIGVEHLVPRLASRLGVIHRGVGVAHDFVGAAVVRRSEGDADAGGGEHLPAADRERRAQRMLYPQRDGVSLGIIANPFSRMANSSPPNRASASPGRRHDSRRREAAISSSSPTR